MEEIGNTIMEEINQKIKFNFNKISLGDELKRLEALLDKACSDCDIATITKINHQISEIKKILKDSEAGQGQPIAGATATTIAGATATTIAGATATTIADRRYKDLIESGNKYTKLNKKTHLLVDFSHFTRFIFEPINSLPLAIKKQAFNNQAFSNKAIYHYLQNKKENIKLTLFDFIVYNAITTLIKNNYLITLDNILSLLDNSYYNVINQNYNKNIREEIKKSVEKLKTYKCDLILKTGLDSISITFKFFYFDEKENKLKLYVDYLTNQYKDKGLKVDFYHLNFRDYFDAWKNKNFTIKNLLISFETIKKTFYSKGFHTKTIININKLLDENEIKSTKYRLNQIKEIIIRNLYLLQYLTPFKLFSHLSKKIEKGKNGYYFSIYHYQKKAKPPSLNAIQAT